MSVATYLEPGVVWDIVREDNLKVLVIIDTERHAWSKAKDLKLCKELKRDGKPT